MGLTRNDVRYLISWVLLVVAAFAAIMGLVSDLWDLNEFVFHKYAAYSLAILGLFHVYFHWRQLVGYSRWRFGRRAHQRRKAASRPDIYQEAAVEREPPARAKSTLLSRRDVIELLLGGIGGFAIGRLLQPQPPLGRGEDIGEIYHEWSKPKLLGLLGTLADWGTRPPLYKEYPEAESIPLPMHDEFRGLHTEEAIQRRRSVRDYIPQSMTKVELSRLLYLAEGINANRWGYGLRAAPSAGALYPIEIYPLIHNVKDLKPGLYHYAVKDHQLELLQTGDLRTDIVRHGLMQEFLGEANLVLILTAIFQRLRWKYRERSYRYALLEAGHIGQNIYLAATSMGLGACAVGAFLDENLNNMLNIDGKKEAGIYMVAVGKK